MKLPCQLPARCSELHLHWPFLPCIGSSLLGCFVKTSFVMPPYRCCSLLLKVSLFCLAQRLPLLPSGQQFLLSLFLGSIILESWCRVKVDWQLYLAVPDYLHGGGWL